MREQKIKTNSAIKILSQKLIAINCKWAITGSYRLFLDGIKIRPNDIDVVIFEKDWSRIVDYFNSEYEIFHTKVCKDINSNYFHFYIHETKVDVFSSLKIKRDGEWIFLYKPFPPLEILFFGDLSINVFSIEMEKKIYQLLREEQKIDLIETFMLDK